MIALNTQFDHYEILAPIGKGGMGEVFRARDTRLNREVALKVLPAEFAQDADRLRRFELEAMATSSLNHPNILTVYDFGTHDSNPYLVMELLEGEELRAQLEAGALAPRKAIDYAQQIAAGLAAAHEKGIVHRDLKPENLFVTKDGRLKILDFGLAKLTQLRIGDRRMRIEEDADTLMQSPDGNPHSAIPNPQLTIPGTVMGTVAYMSPEQVRGQDLEQRSDIFSFGLILYEMLAGQRAFQGKSMAETMAAIANAEPPDLSELNSKVSPQLDKIVRRCLEKKPEMRFHSAHDLGFALEALTVPSGTNQTQTLKALPDSLAEKAGASRFHRVRLWQGVSLLSVIAAMVLALLYFRRPAPETPVTRFSIDLPKGTVTGNIAALFLALSPNGRHLVFSTIDTAGKQQLWLRALDSFVTQPLSGTERGAFPFWSPESRYIAFFADNKLKKLDVGSGVIETICAAEQGQNGNWNQNGVILFGTGAGLVQVNAAGGTPEPVTKLEVSRNEIAHRFPAFLPDGKHFLFQIMGGDAPGIYVGSLNTKGDEARKLLISLGADSADQTPVAWSPPGYLLYTLNRGTLLARAFDADRLVVTGEPFRVVENVVVTNLGAARFTVSANGVLAFIQVAVSDTKQPTWTDRSGRRLGVAGMAAPWASQSGLSPDERFAVWNRSEPNRRTSHWLLDLTQGTTTRIPIEESYSFPVWSPDGKQLAFSGPRNLSLVLKTLAGNVPEEKVFESQFLCYPVSWSPDGKSLIFGMSSRQTRLDLWRLPLTGERQPQPLLQTKFNEQTGKVSPDGNWLAYVSDEAGNNEIYVTQFPQPTRSWQISTSGGTNPKWRADGKELFFVAGNKLMAVSVTLGAEVQPGTPQPLFEIEGTNYAPSKDGQRFLVPVVTEKAPAPPINVVLNWTADLKR